MDENSKALHNLITPMVLREPDLLTASTWHGHIPFAFWIVEALQPKVIVELGAYRGLSYCAFCQAVQELSMNTSCYAVDTWEGDPHGDFYGEEVFQTLSEYHEPKYSAFSRLIRSTFGQALEHFPVGSIDLLHIDGCHTYEAVKQDFTSWQPKLSDRAVVLFHDTNVRERDFGVWRFWEEIILQYPAIEFLHHHGLGVLAVGQQLPALVEWLVRVPKHSPEKIALIRDYFARLGMVIEDHWSNRELKAQLDWRVGEIKNLQGEIASRDGDIQTLRGEIASRDGDIQALQSGNQALVAQLQSHQRDIQSLQGQVQSLQCEVDVREARIDLVHQSLSWKLTSPLRAVDRWLKIRQ
jgi:O-antigen biosynthesis protein